MGLYPEFPLRHCFRGIISACLRALCTTMCTSLRHVSRSKDSVALCWRRFSAVRSDASASIACRGYRQQFPFGQRSAVQIHCQGKNISPIPTSPPKAQIKSLIISQRCNAVRGRTLTREMIWICLIMAETPLILLSLARDRGVQHEMPELLRARGQHRASRSRHSGLARPARQHGKPGG